MGERALARVTKRRPRRIPKKQQPSLARKPHLLLVGEPHRTGALKRALRKIKVTIDEVPNVSSVTDHLRSNSLALLLVSPLPKLRVDRAVARVREMTASNDISIFALASDGIGDNEARRLYKEGATAVVEWPQERSVFPRLLAELLAVDLVHGSMNEPDAALARTIRAHLKLVRGYSRVLRVRVDAGMALISGEVEHLWQKDKIVALASDVPGVQSVVARWLLVEPTSRSDAQIRRSILRMLRDASDIDESTLAVTVEQGYVTLAGSVTDRRELNRIRRLLTHIKGVRNIDRLAVVSPTRKQRDHVVSSRLCRTLSQLFGEQDVHVTHFAGVAVLTGTVARLSTSQAIQSTLEDDEAVERVVNKMEIESVPQKGV